MLEPKFKSNIDACFSGDEIKKLIEFQSSPPSQVVNVSMKGELDLDDYDKIINKKLNKFGAEKGNLSKKKWKTMNKERIDELTKEIKLIQKYRNRIQIMEEGKKTLSGTGYTQPKRNVYKIQSGGQYGNRIIDIPKLQSKYSARAA